MGSFLRGLGGLVQGKLFAADYPAWGERRVGLGGKGVSFGQSHFAGEACGLGLDEALRVKPVGDPLEKPAWRRRKKRNACANAVGTE